MSDAKIKVMDSDKLIKAINEGSYDINLSAVMALGAVTLNGKSALDSEPQIIRCKDCKQIIRCKDCKHYDELDKMCGWCKFHSRTAYAHRFCSEAEKKEVAEPQSKPTKEGRCMIMDGYQTEKYIESLMSTKETNPPKMTGWTCPVCGRGLSPFTSVCPCKGWKGLEITCKT